MKQIDENKWTHKGYRIIYLPEIREYQVYDNNLKLCKVAKRSGTGVFTIQEEAIKIIKSLLTCK